MTSMYPASVQQDFFQEIKTGLPSNISLVDTVAELINISNDSAYRRIRGEKQLTFEEIKLLCKYFNLSLDRLFQLNNSSFLFTGQLIDKDNFGVELFLDNFLQHLNFFNTFRNREIYTSGRDIFVFHYFGFPILTAFKVLFWMKSIFEYPLTARDIFTNEAIQEMINKMTPRLNEAFNRIPSVEIWTEDSINATIRQIDYYRQSKDFPSDEYALKVFESLLEMITHIENQAEHGSKFLPGEKPSTSGSRYRLFVNEFMLGDNSNLAILDGTKTAYINHTSLNVSMTKDTAFAEHTHQYFQKIMRKSTLISGTGEKERKKFFNAMRDKVFQKMKQI